jgi:hypothetical protein
MSPKLFIILAIVLDHRWSLSLHFVSCLVIWLICLKMLVMDDLLCVICTASIAKLGKICRIQLVTQVSTVLSDDKCELFATTLSSFAHRPMRMFPKSLPTSWPFLWMICATCQITNQVCYVCLLFFLVGSMVKGSVGRSISITISCQAQTGGVLLSCFTWPCLWLLDYKH